MASTPFKAISWNQSDLISQEKLQQTAANMNWLRDNTPRAHYRAHGINRTEQVKVATGLALITARKVGYANQQVNFGNFFSPNSRPIVTNGVISSQRAVFVTIQGIGQMHPDHRGFTVYVRAWADTVAERSIKNNMYVSWQAMGY